MISQNTPDPCLVVQWYKGNNLHVCDNEFFPDSTTVPFTNHGTQIEKVNLIKQNYQ